MDKTFFTQSSFEQIEGPPKAQIRVRIFETSLMLVMIPLMQTMGIVAPLLMWNADALLKGKKNMLTFTESIETVPKTAASLRTELTMMKKNLKGKSVSEEQKLISNEKAMKGGWGNKRDIKHYIYHPINLHGDEIRC